MNLNICIVHYNSTDTLPCLKSLAKQTVQMPVLLVNNASTDNSIQAVRDFAAQSPLSIRILEAPANNGFSAGNNIALRWAQQQTPEAWNLLLNNDTLLPADFIERLIQTAEAIQCASATSFALSATEYDYTKQHKHHSGMQYLSIPTGLSFTTGGPLRTPYLCGACLLLDPKAPLWNEDYFLYYEDADYSQRLRAAGYRLLTTDKTHYYHKIGGTTSRNTDIVAIQMTSMWHYYHSYYPHWTPIVKCLRKIENQILGRRNIVRIIDQTYHQSHAK